MGRHSAPDDGELDDSDEAGGRDATGLLTPGGTADTAVDDRPSGRHALVQEDDDAPAVPARPARGTAADLRLLRTHADVRNRCLAALLVPFVAYAVLLIVLGDGDSWLVYLWAPILLAGVLVGVTLDLGHRAHRAHRPAPAGDTDRPAPAAP